MTLYIELEDVICDLESGISDLLQLDVSELTYSKTGELTNINSKELEELLALQTSNFWEELEPTSELIVLKQVLDSYSIDAIKVLTRPYNLTSCKAGKQAWLEAHLPSAEMVFTRSKHVFSNRKSILIDILPGTIQAFKRFGGQGILIPKPWQKSYKEDVKLEDHLHNSFQKFTEALCV